MAKKNLTTLNAGMLTDILRDIFKASKMYSDSLSEFQDNPQGDNLQMVDSTRKALLAKIKVSYAIACPDDTDDKTKEMLRTAQEVTEYNEKQEQMLAI